MLEYKKTDLGRQMVFLGILGHFPGPGAGVIPHSFPVEKNAKWASIIRGVLAAGRIAQNELESLTGKLSVSQTSIFGRFGRFVVKPLYRKHYGPYYQTPMKDRGWISLSWWEWSSFETTPSRSVTSQALSGRDYLYGRGHEYRDRG